MKFDSSTVFGIIIIVISLSVSVSFVYAVDPDPFAFQANVVTGSVLLDDITRDSLGNWYVSFQTQDRVKKYDSGWNYQFDVCSNLDNPQGLAIDSNDDLWVADTNNYRYVECDTTQATNNKSSFTPQPKDTDCSQSNDNRPSTIAIDRSDKIYISLFCGNTAVITYDTSGVFQDTFVDYTHYSECASGKAFSNISDIHIDSDDSVYVADSNCQRVQKFNSSGSLLETFSLPSAANLQSVFALDNTSDVFVINGYHTFNIITNEREVHWKISKFSSDGTFMAGYADKSYLEPRGIHMSVSDRFYVTTGFDGDLARWES